MHRITLVQVAAILAMACHLHAAPAGDSLEAGFRQPPAQARLRCYWWWLNGNVTKGSITRDLEGMRAKGFGGAMLIDAGGAEQRGNRQVPAGPLFGSPAWRDLFHHALSEAQRLNLEISLNILSGWNLGGPTVTPEQSAKLVTWSKTTIKGPAAVDQPLPAPPAKQGFYRDIAVLAYPLRHGAAPSSRPLQALPFKGSFKEAGFSTPVTTPLLFDLPAEAGEEDTHAEQVATLSSQMDASGRLRWTAPAGEWEILRFGYTTSGSRVSTSSGDWQGLVIDYLDHGALDKYWRTGRSHSRRRAPLSGQDARLRGHRQLGTRRRQLDPALRPRSSAGAAATTSPRTCPSSPAASSIAATPASASSTICAAPSATSSPTSITRAFARHGRERGTRNPSRIRRTPRRAGRRPADVWAAARSRKWSFGPSRRPTA